MRNKLIYKYVGKVLLGFSFLLLAPFIVCLIYGESIIPFVVPFFTSLLLGLYLNGRKVKNTGLYAKDGLIIVALSWILISLLSAVPIYLGTNASFIDSFFESVSGLTTTGASIFSNVEVLSKSILFWRSYIIFIGGMGVLTFVMALLPLAKGDKSLHILNAEMPGPSVSKLTPGIKKTLFYLYAIYLVLTVIEIILLLFGNLPFFDSLLISMSTAGTGGFAMLNDGIASYGMYNQYVIAVFMLLFGVNFNVYFLIAMKDFKSALKSEELKAYGIIFAGLVAVVILNTYNLFSSFSETFLSAFFHVSSVMTSTGFSIGDINIYSTACRILFLCAMLVSACSGSTCGGFKISRLLITLKSIKRDFLRAIHPNSVQTITFEGKEVDDNVTKAISSYLFLYVLCIVIIMVLVSFDGLTLSETANAVFTTFSNNGLCFEISNFSIFSDFSKIIMSIGMLLGRLEIYPLIVIFTRYRKWN